MTGDTVLRAASLSKLVLSIVALQLHEEGNVDLHASVETLLPEVASLKVMTNFKDGKEEIRNPVRPITLQ